ncbi:ATP-NAD kinase [Coccomyxa subellipsoidea C-169]|uniref:ATP-NAD kinase n=1 Tax=Coccomyxa subellipsoidea (strain C-169) TaxID=574566 RepID=I0YL16_COCSC|nr:ATP-NAD kinase [Coccomyxa subellipsoidea C-169]EIE19085.1 ATP-NAD kinase [Coccomyxa subellipsoidea C-169]|eukprot:XP_005643629.1 ATP-NAD kinase [Coccomyxa subellipsoidea C-169]
MQVFSESPGLKLQRRAFIVWDDGGPKSVFIVKKPHSLEASAKMKEIGDWLTSKGLNVLVERSVHMKEFPEFGCFEPRHNEVDFCVTLGGDGTVLHIASLFTEDEPLPPIASFAMGTLGFLTPFDAADFQECLQRVLTATELPVFCTLRTRKRCELFRDGEVHAVHHVLNECLIDRGSSPSMVRLELYVDGHHITTVRADGLIIATPSGSTAYSLSSGGPMVAPSVPCALLTPIAPHSLSFRPLVVPEASDIEIHLPATSRSHARASFDGRNTQRMMAGSSMRCTTSLCALPVINLAPLDNDWYDGIVQKLKWNVSIREIGRLPSLKKHSFGDNNSAAPLSRS